MCFGAPNARQSVPVAGVLTNRAFRLQPGNEQEMHIPALGEGRQGPASDISGAVGQASARLPVPWMPAIDHEACH